MAILPTDIRILFTNYDIIAYFFNLASCSEHFISITHRILATFNINKKNQFERLYVFKDLSWSFHIAILIVKLIHFVGGFFLLTLFMMPGITWVKSENAKYQIMTRPHSKYSCNPILCAVVLFFVFVSFSIHVLCIKCSLCLFTLSFIIVRSPLTHITNGIRNDQCLSTNHVTIDFFYLSRGGSRISS
jgi:hypothetical protein